MIHLKMRMLDYEQISYYGQARTYINSLLLRGIMKLISWNVNGIRAILGKGHFQEFVAQENPDILCLQETKAMREQVQGLELKGYEQFWNSADKKGYSGTAIFTKKSPDSIQYDLPQKEHRMEGRVIAAEFPKFHLVNVYTPNAQHKLARIDYRMKWDRDFLNFVHTLDKSKPVIFCGDLNVAHKEIDLANPEQNRMNPGFSDQERAGFENILGKGFIDTFREFNKEPEQYSWWTYRFNARQRNIGWRIDYWMLSNDMRTQLKDAFIRQDVLGSDHCPVGMILK